jgi:hypothetical protein
VDGKPVGLAARYPTDQAFPVTVCEATVPFGGVSATIDTLRLKMPVALPKRILLLGDTGCRLQFPVNWQACNNPAAWPTARVAAIAAGFAPDLIVHVGDYYYRESACPPGGFVDCAGSPHGDIWESWYADWFQPAAPLLGLAPMALARGNHESCGRGQKGWYHLLSPFAFDPGSDQCAEGSALDFQPPYLVTAGPVSLLVLDTSYVSDRPNRRSAGNIDTLRRQMDTALAQQTRPVFLVTHKPAYGLISADGTQVSGGSNDVQALFSGGVPDSIGLLIAGHIHNFQAVQLADRRFAPQLVVGNGGTLHDPTLVPVPQRNVPFRTEAGGVIGNTVDTLDRSEYGFALLDRTETGYAVTSYDVNGMIQAHCLYTLQGRTLSCHE